MKCPLRTTTTHYPDERVGIDDWDCLKEECAWWDVGDELCCLRTLAKSVYFIHKDLLDLVDKMPHEGQFRK